MQSNTEYSTVNAYVFEVDKSNLKKTRVVALNLDKPLHENEVILKVDKFALTANNISYAIAGDSLGYWRFFPSESLSSTMPILDNMTSPTVNLNSHWGRLPVMGFADVVASNNSDIKVGERVWGFMPMATHVKIIAGRINDNGFSDVSPYREGLAPLYSAFERVHKNPFYAPKNEDFEILLRGLFTTSWLVDDFMDDNQYFDATQYLITSASSKTSIALAFAIKERGKIPSIGITSTSNCEFVKSLGCYDQVISYDEIETLDATTRSVLVDMAGSETVLSTIHHHFQAQLRYSCRIGATHHRDLVQNELTTASALPGVTPTFFFAPTQFKKRINEWGTNETMKHIGLSLLNYISFCRNNITINHTLGKNNVDPIYQQVLSGTADASKGQIISL